MSAVLISSMYRQPYWPPRASFHLRLFPYPTTKIILSPPDVWKSRCGILYSPEPLPLYSTRTPKSSRIPRSLLMIFFSAAPVSSAARMCSFLGLSATFSMNLNRPTVVFPAAVVPSRNSTGASHCRKALYFSDSKSRSALTIHHRRASAESGHPASSSLSPGFRTAPPYL